MTKRSILQADVTVLGGHVPNRGIKTHEVKTTRTPPRSQTTITDGDFNIFLLQMGIFSRQRSSKDIIELNSTINQ